MAVLTDRNKLERELSKIIARIWIDEEFHLQFLNAPKYALKEAGLELQDYLDLQVVDLDSTVPTLRAVAGEKMICDITLPSKPGDLTDEEIETSIEETVAEGGWCGGIGCCC